MNNKIIRTFTFSRITTKLEAMGKSYLKIDNAPNVRNPI